MKNKRKFFLKKRSYLLLLLLLLIILLPTLFLGSIYFSPGRSKNFAIGQNTAQINFTPGGINIFYPKDDTTFYYFHNLSWPQQITGTNTKISDPNSTHSESSFTYFKKLLASFFPQPEFKQPGLENSSEKEILASPNFENTQKNSVPKIDISKWQKFTNDYYSLIHPIDWQIEDEEDYLMAFDPSRSYQTYSHAGRIEERYVNIEKLQYSSKSAKQYVDERFAKNAEDNRKSEEDHNRFIKEYPSAASNIYSYQNPYPLYWGRENTRINNLDIEIYSGPRGKDGDEKSFVISNGIVLITGYASLRSLNDGSVESFIIKSIAPNK